MKCKVKDQSEWSRIWGANFATYTKHKATIIGVIKKMGKYMIGWDYDQSLITPYRFARELINEKNSRPKIIVKGKENVSSQALANDLEGMM